LLKGKRANGEGTIYRRKDGRWAAAVSLDRGVRKHFLGRTREEVARKLAVGLKASHDGVPLPNERLTTAQFLRDWLQSARPSVRVSTYDRYEQLLRLHALPALGRIPLARLTPQHLQRLYAEKLASGLSPRSVHHLHAVLHRALRQASCWGVVPRNVADLVAPPRGQRRQMSCLSPDQARTLLATASGDRLEAVYALAVTTGMRRGEILALQWKYVDLETGSLQVVGTLQRTREGLSIAEPKTDRSRRQVALSATAAQALRKHRAAQASQRLLLGAAWQDLDLVFTNDIGGPMEPANLIRRSFQPLLKRAGLPPIRFHDLRHTAATLMLSQGVHPKIVSEMLGHSQINITLDLYSHVTPTLQRQAAAAVDDLLSL